MGANNPQRRISQVSELIISALHVLLIGTVSFALAHSVPYLSATLAFITYTRVKEEFDVAIIFSSLALFQVSDIYRLSIREG